MARSGELTIPSEKNRTLIGHLRHCSWGGWKSDIYRTYRTFPGEMAQMAHATEKPDILASDHNGLTKGS